MFKFFYLTIILIKPFSDFSQHYSDLFENVVVYFESEWDEIRTAASFAIGNLAVGSKQYLPKLINLVQSNTNLRYLSLQSLKEVITYSLSSLNEISENIYNILFEISKDEDESTRNVAAECLGKLAISNPIEYLPKLKVGLFF